MEDNTVADIQFAELDEDRDGFISADMIARFMRRSQKNDATLSQVRCALSLQPTGDAHPPCA